MRKYLESEFWKSGEVEWFAAEPIDVNKLLLPSGAIIFETSGSSGEKKWVVHTRESLLFSAKSVVSHLYVASSDVWFLALPIYHVGGFGVLARAYISGCGVFHYSVKWDAIRAVLDIAENGVTICSLVPTQIVDIVRANLECPIQVRAVVVGGGKLDLESKLSAIKLGWPILESYGMTETGSQIATQLNLNDFGIPLIEGWEISHAESGALKVRGAGLLTGYLRQTRSKILFEDPKSKDGWFTTSDLVEIDQQSGTLNFKSRTDRIVKILGELVNLDLLENELHESCGFRVNIVDVPDQRRGVSLIPVVETKHQSGLDRSQFDLSGLHKLEPAVFVDEFPENAMGKLDRRRLRESVVFSDE